MNFKYQSLCLYYFSGTGNAKTASTWVAQSAKEKGLEVEVHNISKLADTKIPTPKKGSLVGFFFPTHGFNAPPIVLSFLAHFPRSKNHDVFLVNTRAGMKIHKLVTPGISGIAQYLSAGILAAKGYRTVGWRPLDLPSNWIPLHPALRGRAVEYIFSRCKETMLSFTDKILTGKRVLRGLIDLPIDILISPIAFMYFFIGRFALAKAFVASNDCDHCGLCITQCPVHAIEEKAGRLYWKYTCESCMKCMNNCHKNAIETPHGFTVILWWLAFSIIPSYLTGLLLQDYVYKYAGRNALSENVFEFSMTITGMLCLFAAYWVLHFTMKLRPISWLVTYTSLTKLPFWGRYKALKQKQKVE